MLLKVAVVKFLILIVAASGRDIRFALNEDHSLQVYTIVFNKVAYSQKACIFRGKFFLYPCKSYDRPRLRLLRSEDLFQSIHRMQDFYMALPSISMAGLIPVRADCIVGATPFCSPSNSQMIQRSRSEKRKPTQKAADITLAKSNGREDQDDSNQTKIIDDIESKKIKENKTQTEEKQPVPESQDISSPASEEFESKPDKDDVPVI